MRGPISEIYLLLVRMALSSCVSEVSHSINGLLSLSTDQSLSLKSVDFSILKRESISVVACKLIGDNLLCSSKNFCFAVILIHSITYPQFRQPPTKSRPEGRQLLSGHPPEGSHGPPEYYCCHDKNDYEPFCNMGAAEIAGEHRPGSIHRVSEGISLGYGPYPQGSQS